MQQQQVEQQQSGLTADALADAFAKAMAKVPQQSQQPAQQQPLSQEEVDQYLKTFRPTAGLVEALFGDTANADSRLAALNYIVDGLRANMDARTYLQAQHQLTQYGQQLEPDLQELRHIAESKFFEEMYDGHSGLKGHEAVIRELLPRFREAEDYPKASRREQPSYVRSKMIELLKKNDPNFNPVDQPQQQQPPNVRQGHFQQQQPRQQPGQQQSQGSTAPNVLSGGGSSGGNSSSPAAGNKSSGGFRDVIGF